MRTIDIIIGLALLVISLACAGLIIFSGIVVYMDILRAVYCHGSCDAWGFSL